MVEVVGRWCSLLVHGPVLPQTHLREDGSDEAWKGAVFITKSKNRHFRRTECTKCDHGMLSLSFTGLQWRWGQGCFSH
jgi:hypothetical protein